VTGVWMSTSRMTELLWIFGVCLVTAGMLLWLAPNARAQEPLRYPAAPRGPAVDDFHGVRVADPYRWLEDLDSPATHAWVAAQAQLTASYLAAIPGRERLRLRLTALYDFEKVGIPFKEDGRYFYTSNSGRQEQSVLYVTSELSARGSLALDPNLLPAANHPVVVGYLASRDARLMAYGVSQGGSDWTDWHLRDLATGQDLPDVLRFTKYYRPVFTPDGKGLYYSAFPAPAVGHELSSEDLNNAIYYHAIGTPAAADRRVLANAEHPDWQFAPYLTPDGRWLVVLAGEGEVGDKTREDVYLIDLSAAGTPPVVVSRGFAAAFLYIGADHGRLYFLSSLHAPNGRVLAIDPLHAADADWQEVIPAGAEAIDLGIGSGSVTLVGHSSRCAQPRAAVRPGRTPRARGPLPRARHGGRLRRPSR
jgi:prolyl oligopeptidase